MSIVDDGESKPESEPKSKPEYEPEFEPVSVGSKLVHAVAETATRR